MTATGPRRVTIADIAKRAGVSKGAVSYALNGRPGISDATRARILELADEMAWYPNRAARALSAARADACGLVLARPSQMVSLEPFYMDFISGVEAELSSRSRALTIQLVKDVEEEIAVYRRWWSERRVDGLLMVDPRVDDPRIGALEQLGLPAVVVGGPLEGETLPTVWHDERTVVTEVVRYLAALGHERMAYVAGVPEFIHTVARVRAFRDAAGELGVQARVVSTDYTPESGSGATRRLLSDPERPTAVVYDSALLAVTGLGVVQHMGLSVPDDLSIVGWDDSLISQVVHPPLTAVSRDIRAYGVAATRELLRAIDGEPVSGLQTARGELTPRASTGRPRAVSPA